LLHPILKVSPGGRKLAGRGDEGAIKICDVESENTYGGRIREMPVTGILETRVEKHMNIYYLQRFEVRELPARGLLRVHLHGIRRGWRGQVIKQKEFVDVPLREQEPVQITIRRAVAASPHVWKVSLLKNVFVFDGKFYQPVPEQVPKLASEEQQN
jgi:hypothetical protein